MSNRIVLRLCSNCKINRHGVTCFAVTHGVFCECREKRCRDARLRPIKEKREMPSDIEWVDELPAAKERIDLTNVHRTLKTMRQYPGKPAKIAAFTNKGTAGNVRAKLQKSGDYQDFTFRVKATAGTGSILYAVCNDT